MKLYQFLIYVLFFLQLIYAHGIHVDHDEDEDEDHDHDHEVEGEDYHSHVHEKQYSSYVTLIGIFLILLCSFLGTILPVIFKRSSFFKETTLLFGCVKLFGTGIILSTAFIHIVIPADHILTSKYTYKLFNEDYTSFAGVFTILGIVLTHSIQVITSHLLYKNADLHLHEDLSTSSNGSDVTVSVDKLKNEMDIVNRSNYSVDQKRIQRPKGHIDACSEDQHGILHMMESKEKQIICYLLEIGISIHSILIGIAYGMTNNEELIILMIALMFHQFFEGVSLSSVFIEAHFKRSTAIIIMICVYTLTLPIGAVIGVIIRSAIQSTDRVYLTSQGIIDALAGGILIYDDVVNILTRHCTSELFRDSTFFKKNIQLFSFYCGIIVMAIIGLWA